MKRRAAEGSVRRSRSGASDAPGPTLRSFAPIARPDAQVLVLGSMPGAMSLRLQQYYAHPQNAFWKIMAALLGFDPAAPYTERVAALQAAGVALWDVLAACERPGSLDSAIARDSAVPNDFAAFFAQHPRIVRVCFNGATAAEIFRRQVLPELPPGSPVREYLRLPSTSPAHAGMRVGDKVRAWEVVRPFSVISEGASQFSSAR